MELKNKNVLIVGLARTGIAVARVLHRLGAKVIIIDSKNADELKDIITSLDGLNVQFALGTEGGYFDIDGIDLIVMSPGVPKEQPLVNKAIENNIEVISEIELAFRLSKTPIIAITGTNGKTTTTALIGEIFKEAEIDSVVAGNIGVPIISYALDMKEEGVIIAEVSSFQLESVSEFKPKIGVVLNITEDHLDRHKTMENYIAAKLNITSTQTPEDYIVLNAEDRNISIFKYYTKAKIVLFSVKNELEEGVYIKEGKISVNLGGKITEICLVDDVFIQGEHNLENALAAVSVSYLWGIDSKIIKSSLMNFKGMEHRLEFVRDLNGINFFNDSKGTNPDSSIKALQAFKGPIILIAGGMDKGHDFNQFLEAGVGKIKKLFVLGETADKIAQTARELGILNIEGITGIQEAVKKGFELGSPGDTVLLSPACASWDMFTSFEERGDIFKQAVNDLGR